MYVNMDMLFTWEIELFIITKNGSPMLYKLDANDTENNSISIERLTAK